MAREGLRGEDRPGDPFRKTRKTEVEAQIELGRLLAPARAGHQSDSGATVSKLLDAYAAGRRQRSASALEGPAERASPPATSAHR